MTDLYLLVAGHHTIIFKGFLLEENNFLNGKSKDDTGYSILQGKLKKRKLEFIQKYDNDTQYTFRFKLNKQRTKGRGNCVAPNEDKLDAFCFLLKVPIEFNEFMNLAYLDNPEISLDTEDIEN